MRTASGKGQNGSRRGALRFLFLYHFIKSLRDYDADLRTDFHSVRYGDFLRSRGDTSCSEDRSGILLREFSPGGIRVLRTDDERSGRYGEQRFFLHRIGRLSDDSCGGGGRRRPDSMDYEIREKTERPGRFGISAYDKSDG